MKTTLGHGIEDITIINHYLPGHAEILVNVTKRWGPRLLLNCREYKDGKVSLAASFDDGGPILQFEFKDVPEHIGKLIERGLTFYAQEKDQQCILFVRFPNDEEMQRRVLVSSSEGKLVGAIEGIKL